MRSNPESDALLAQRVRDGDAAAFDRLVDRHMRAAFAVAWRVLGQREDAEDAVQEAFLSALQHIDSFDASREFRPWLLRIVLNQSLNARKYRERRRMDTIPEHTPAAGASPAAAVEHREMRERMERALELLPERQRTIVRLSGYDGLSSSAIGELLHLPAGTVRWEMHQARRALKQALAVCSGGES